MAAFAFGALQVANTESNVSANGLLTSGRPNKVIRNTTSSLATLTLNGNATINTNTSIGFLGSGTLGVTENFTKLGAATLYFRENSYYGGAGTLETITISQGAVVLRDNDYTSASTTDFILSGGTLEFGRETFTIRNLSGSSGT